MKNSMKRLFALVLCLTVVFAFAAVTSYAAQPLDEILNYQITADLNEDGTVNLKYHIDWKVLDSDSYGPLTDVKVGIPNSRWVDYYGLSDTVDSIYYETDYGQDIMHIYLDRSYYKDEVVSFEFEVVQDYLYEMNAYEEGYTLYYFVPGWFDEITVDNLDVYWNMDKASSWTSGGFNENGYIHWNTSLQPGDRFELKISYPNDAFMFDETKSYNNPDDWNGGNSSSSDGFAEFFIGLIAFFLVFGLPIYIIGKAVKSTYNKASGFASGDTTTKITRTKIEYYPNCPGCGAVRKEGQTVCEYCGRSLVKSEEVIEEKKLKDEDKGALKYKKNGEYRYTSDPNTYVRVNVIHVPVSHSSSSRSSSSGRSSGRSGGGSSCAHSSCACACASCACACACACAGGGRAGCTTKDFYNTKLKLKQLEMKKKK